MTYEDELYKRWRKARMKFIADNPSTAKALALTIPSPSGDEEHVASVDCWCGPDVSYVDPQMGVAVYVHKWLQ